MSLETRVTELQQLHWKRQEKLAEQYQLVKPEGVSWDDFCIEIADAEAKALADDSITVLDDDSEIEPIAAPVDCPIPGNTESALADGDSVDEFHPDTPPIVSETCYTTQFFERSGIPYCEMCGERFLSDNDGSPLCPDNLANCPRRANVTE